MTGVDHHDIDGMQPGTTVRPTTAGAVAMTLAAAQADGLAVAPVGGGGALHLGNPIERYDIALDMRGLDRILDHQATDLVLSVEAGAYLGDVSEVLARHGQWIPIEAPDPGQATIGGLIATALSGPGRATHGSLRDSLIGIAVVGPGGSIAKAGGMVVKNVSGFDLMRLHHGALGTLGVIVSANFKVLPKHRGEATVLVEVAALGAALDVVARAQGLGERPSAVVIERSGGEVTQVALRFDGRASQVASAARVAAQTIGGGASVVVEDESRDWWRRSTDRLGRPRDESIEMRFGATPKGAGALSEAISRALDPISMPLRSLVVWPELGTVIARWHASPLDAGVDAMVAAADGCGATWRIVDAPPEIKRGRDVWGRAPGALDTIRRLKAEFDPARTLNPGRFCGHI